MTKKLAFILFILFCCYDGYNQTLSKYCSGKHYKGYFFDTSYLVLKSIVNQKGKLQLNCNDIILAEKILRKNLKQVNYARINQVQSCPDIDRKLHKYRRQYFGFQNTRGERIVWINLFWSKSLLQQWKSAVIMVNDGCSYYWNVEVNLNTGTLSNLHINGNG